MAFQTTPVELCSHCNFAIPASTPISLVDPTHDFATPSSRPLVGQILEQIETELVRYDEHIAQLQSVIQSVINERQKLLEHHVKWKHAIAGIRRLPVETLTEIFSLACHEDQPERDSQPQVNDDNVLRYISAFCLSHVCSQWRAILLAIPKLWATLVVDLRHETCTSMSMVMLYLKRSKDASLNIRLRFPLTIDASNTNCRKLSDLIECYTDPHLIPCHCSSNVLSYLIEESAGRWSSLYLHEFSHAWAGLLAPLQEKLTNLTSLRISFFEWYIDGSDIQPFEFLPSLSHVEIENSLIEDSAISWENLTTVHLYQTNVSFILHLLRTSQNIIRLGLSSTCSDNESEDMVTSTSVTSLSVDGRDPEFMDVLSWIALPNLESLSTIISASRRSVICSFLERSGSHLQTLSLDMCGYNTDERMDTEFREILHHTPQLTELSIKAYKVGEEFLDCLTCTPTHAFLPRLARISFSCSDSALDILASMLDSRMTSGSVVQLEKVSLRILTKMDHGFLDSLRSDPFLSQFISRMKALMSAGVRMQLSLEQR